MFGCRNASRTHQTNYYQEQYWVCLKQSKSIHWIWIFMYHHTHTYTLMHTAWLGFSITVLFKLQRYKLQMSTLDFWRIFTFNDRKPIKWRHHCRLLVNTNGLNVLMQNIVEIQKNLMSNVKMSCVLLHIELNNNLQISIMHVMVRTSHLYDDK